jgi:hypothetical protein
MHGLPRANRSCFKSQIRTTIQLFQRKRVILNRGADYAYLCTIFWTATLSIALTSKGHPGSCDAGERWRETTRLVGSVSAMERDCLN